MNDFLLRMKSLLGDEFDEFLKFYNSDDFIKGLRVNTLKCSPEKLCSLLDFELKKTPFCDEGFYIPSDVKSIGNNPLHHAGAFYVQEPSATSAVTMLDVHEGDYVLDLCAAPGGKSTQIGAKLNGTGLLWSNEIVRSRANILLSNIERMGISNAVVSNCRPDELCKRLENRFDRILVDAPCSGEGMFRKEPQAVQMWSPENIALCAARQAEILRAAARMLAPGGTIVYSTCTFAPEEDEGTLSRFLERHPEFSVQQGQLVIELNERILPHLSVNAEYAALMNTSDDPEVQRYVKEKLSEAQALIKGVHTRCDTLVQMLTLIGREQHGFFCGGEALLPVTMQQLSEKMGVSTSTVSRAAQNKYIQFQGRIIPVRSFFTTAIRPDAAVSSHAVKQRLQSLIRAEDPASPLSDEALRLALSALGIEVSRRAIAKYRAEMDIPSSSQRKKR